MTIKHLEKAGNQSWRWSSLLIGEASKCALSLSLSRVWLLILFWVSSVALCITAGIWLIVYLTNAQSWSYLDQQRDGATLVHFQDLAVLRPHQNMAVTQWYGTYGGVVLQEKPCARALNYSVTSRTSFQLKARNGSDGFALDGGLFTFGARSQDRPLDGVGLEAPFEGVVPQSHYTILTSRHKALRGWQCGGTFTLNNAVFKIRRSYIISLLEMLLACVGE